MCEYKVLHQSENGCVVMCSHCESVRVLFGTVSLDLTQKQFYEFRDTVVQYLEMSQCRPENLRGIYIPTASLSVHLLYSPKDLKELNEVLEDAYLCLEIEKLLKHRYC